MLNRYFSKTNSESEHIWQKIRQFVSIPTAASSQLYMLIYTHTSQSKGNSSPKTSPASAQLLLWLHLTALEKCVLPQFHEEHCHVTQPHGLFTAILAQPSQISSNKGAGISSGTSAVSINYLGGRPHLLSY